MEYLEMRVEKVEFPVVFCDNCKDEIDRTEYHITNGFLNFCSIQCANKWMKKNQAKIKVIKNAHLIKEI